MRLEAKGVEIVQTVKCHSTGEPLRRLGDADEGDRAAKRLFAVSILYLFVLFAVLLIDDRLGAPGRGLLWGA